MVKSKVVKSKFAKRYPKEFRRQMVTCRLSADHFRLRKWLFRDWLLTVVT